jgi:NHLM bacteriocin system ABC transporter ATP-binding protein
MGIEEIRRTLSGVVVTVALSGLFSLANFILLIHYDPGLAGYAALLILAAMLMAAGISYFQLQIQRAVARLHAKTAGLVLQLLTGVAKLKMVGAEVQGFERWASMFSDQRQKQVRANTLSNTLTVVNAVFPVAGTLVIFAAAAPKLLVEPPLLATGDFLGFIAAFNLALGGTLSSSGAALYALTVIPLYEQVRPILRAEPEVHTGKHDPGELSGSLELQHVSFRYRADSPVILSNVCLRAQAGEFVALVGPSGSGKSTVLRLLIGFEYPDSGSVSYDEQDLCGLDIEAVRRQIGVVLQSGHLMAGDLFTNIVGSANATLEDAWEAARMAGIAEDIHAMPMGMHTVVNVGGGSLSGGQRQRLMIARALVRRPRILFFDEATSALDNRTQELVTRSLDRLNVTRLVVAHRLSTIRGADRIYVLNAGKIVDYGSYGDLLDRDGLFSDLVRRQML